MRVFTDSRLPQTLFAKFEPQEVENPINNQKLKLSARDNKQVGKVIAKLCKHIYELADTIEGLVNNPHNQNPNFYEYYTKVIKAVLDHAGSFKRQDIQAIHNVNIINLPEYRHRGLVQKVCDVLKIITGCLISLAGISLVSSGALTITTWFGLPKIVAGSAITAVGAQVIHHGVKSLWGEKQVPIKEVNRIKSDMEKLNNIDNQTVISRVPVR
jgi:Ca2+/Na+ antiporter